MLTNSHFSKQKDTNPEVKICETKRGGTFPYLKQGKELTFSTTNETFRIKTLDKLHLNELDLRNYMHVQDVDIIL